MNSGNSTEYISYMQSYMIKSARFDLIELAKCTTFSEILKTLKHTQYYNVLKKLKVNSDGRIDFTDAEVKLRTYYFEWQFEMIQKH